MLFSRQIPMSGSLFPQDKARSLGHSLHHFNKVVRAEVRFIVSSSRTEAPPLVHSLIVLLTDME